ncbi:hypothetical protein ACFOD0_14160 [Shewanella intestini]|uniref:PhoP regulatory network protein YrbL n=1 Tax=Shewanella intestini TaxID=2017544 RepID=A0ABS5I5N9_9GAMM|nr:MULTISPECIES: hypothetical protein [Shewanella]MBR9729029.1 hypothetical protein [Shewanella intestini]MRG36905.1 hypothetical protein [Shewanella sp. XMDDZSB0408]
MKAVVNGVYETNKMRVELSHFSVTKQFKKVGNSLARYHLEKKALQRLAHQKFFPEIIQLDDESNVIEMSRIPGQQPDSLSVEHVNTLRKMIDTMINKGVARHAIPIRDLLVDGDNIGMVDFERVTLRHLKYSPIWYVAEKVTYYHLYRLIQKYQPQALTPSEMKVLDMFNNARARLQPIRHFITAVKTAFKSN